MRQQCFVELSTTAGESSASAACGSGRSPFVDGSSITSTMYMAAIDRSELIPLHDQVAAEIRRAIADGEAGPGERLPLAKDMAAVLGVNKNTVLRALHILREEGLLEFRRGRGITVAGTPQKSAVLGQVRDLLSFARSHGYRADEVIKMIESVSSAPARVAGGQV